MFGMILNTGITATGKRNIIYRMTVGEIEKNQKNFFGFTFT